MALINKDTRIARFSADGEIGWVPLVPNLESYESFDEYVVEYDPGNIDYGNGPLMDALLEPGGSVWDDAAEDLDLDLYALPDGHQLFTAQTKVYAFVEGRTPTSAPLAKAIIAPSVGGGEPIVMRRLSDIASRCGVYVPDGATVIDVLNIISIITNSPIWALNAILPRTGADTPAGNVSLGLAPGQNELSWIAYNHRSAYVNVFTLLDQELRASHGVTYAILPDDDHTDVHTTDSAFFGVADRSIVKTHRYHSSDVGRGGRVMELRDLDSDYSPNLHGGQPEARTPELLRLDKYLATLGNAPRGTNVFVAIYSTNKGDTVTINGTRIPAFKVTVENLYERCELYGRTDFQIMRKQMRAYGVNRGRPPQFGDYILNGVPSGNAVLAYIQKQR
jgi:hypothetical protein